MKPGSRTPFEGMRATPTAQQEARTETSGFETGLTDVQDNQQAGQTPSNMSFLGPQLGIRTGNDFATGQRPQPSQFESGFGGDGVGSPSAQTPLHKKLADMTDQERYGLPGLLSMIPLESPDYSSLAMGQDLTVLGLDLSRPESVISLSTFQDEYADSTVTRLCTRPSARPLSNPTSSP
jgi:CCR4-NOT transcription complex subunit 2